MSAGLRPTHGGTGPWLLTLICCGFDDGTWRCPTWEEADELRESYVNAEGHERSAILSSAEDTLRESDLATLLSPAPPESAVAQAVDAIAGDNARPLTDEQRQRLTKRLESVETRHE